jgi:hypothetical protein
LRIFRAEDISGASSGQAKNRRYRSKDMFFMHSQD